MWNDHGELVTTRQCVLPDVCIKCNAPASLKLTKKFYWHEPWLYVLLLTGVLPFAIVAMVLRKDATLNLGLCPVHARRRTQRIVISWSIMGLGVVMLVGGIALANRAMGRGYEGFGIVMILLSFLTMILAGVFAAVGLTLLRPRRIDDRYAWFKGASPELVHQLPSIG